MARRRLVLGWLGVLVGCVSGSGCLEPSLQRPAPEASQAPAVRNVAVFDARGRRWPLDGAPRRPAIRVATTPDLGGYPEPVRLLEGMATDALRDDLADPPLRQDTEGRLVPVRRERTRTEVTLRPSAPLEPGALYTLAVGAWAADLDGRALDAAHTTTLRVAPRGGGAVPTDAWPAGGTAGVSPHLPVAALRFDGPVEHAEQGARLERTDGAVVGTALDTRPCAALGWDGGHCLAFRPHGPLAPLTGYRLVLTRELKDRTGAAIGPWQARFRTAAAPPGSPVELIPPTCALDEMRVGPGCVLADDGRTVLRIGAAGPFRAWLRTGAVTARAVAPRGTAALELAPLPPATSFEAQLELVDLAGHVHTDTLALATTPRLPAVYITEVRADPRGPEPHQEYIEVVNFEPNAVDLHGFDISDRADATGDVIDRHVVLQPGARALLVADRFDPVHPDDPPVPPGVPLIRMGSSLASGGLTNAGEPLFLRDSQGRRLSAVPATPRPRAGVCRVRIADDGRVGGPGTFGYDPKEGCTPGSPDRLP